MGKEFSASFDICEYTKNVLIAASYIHLKYREYAKYASELPTVNPRILLSGPAGSEIYQEMLAKALAKYFGATLLLSDSHAFMGVRSVIPIWVSLLLTENNSNEGPTFGMRERVVLAF